MRRDVLVGLGLPRLVGLLLAGACSGETKNNEDGGRADGAAIDTAAIDASEASPATGVCNDDTSDLACCPADAVGGARCDTVTSCATRCVQGVHGHMYCSGGTWLAGHGLFPCGAASGQSGGAGNASAD